MQLDHRISGYDFVRAMLLAGFRLTRSSMGYAIVEKDGVRLYVPQGQAMSEREIEVLLRQGNVPEHLFMMYLHRLGSRDTVPEQSEVEASDARR